MANIELSSRENAADGFGGVHAQRLQFAQQEQAEDVVDVGVGENGSGDRRLANPSSQARPRMQFGSGFDLRAQIGRSSEQKPGSRIGADGNLCLGAGFAVEGSGAHGAAVRAGAIPLGESSASGRTENLHAHD